MGDVVGRLFREFAVTLAITILISAVVSLTLVPMMSARWLKFRADDAAEREEARLGARLLRLFKGVVVRYDHALTWAIDHETMTLAAAVATRPDRAALPLHPQGAVPDPGHRPAQARVETADDVSNARMAELQQAGGRRRLCCDPAVENVSSFIGVDAANNTMLHTGRMLIDLKPDHGDQVEVMARLQERAHKVAGVTLYLQPTQDLTIDAETGPTEFRVSLEGADTATVTNWVNKLVAQMRTESSCATRPATPARTASPPSSTSTATPRRASASPQLRSTTRSTAPSASASSRRSSPRPTSTASSSRRSRACSAPPSRSASSTCARARASRRRSTPSRRSPSGRRRCRSRTSRSTRRRRSASTPRPASRSAPPSTRSAPPPRRSTCRRRCSSPSSARRAPTSGRCRTSSG